MKTVDPKIIMSRDNTDSSPSEWDSSTDDYSCDQHDEDHQPLRHEAQPPSSSTRYYCVVISVVALALVLLLGGGGLAIGLTSGGCCCDDNDDPNADVISYPDDQEELNRNYRSYRISGQENLCWLRSTLAAFFAQAFALPDAEYTMQVEQKIRVAYTNMDNLNRPVKYIEKATWDRLKPANEYVTARDHPVFAEVYFPHAEEVISEMAALKRRGAREWLPIVAGSYGNLYNCNSKESCGPIAKIALFFLALVQEREWSRRLERQPSGNLLNPPSPRNLHWDAGGGPEHQEIIPKYFEMAIWTMTTDAGRTDLRENPLGCIGRQEQCEGTSPEERNRLRHALQRDERGRVSPAQKVFIAYNGSSHFDIFKAKVIFPRNVILPAP